ncbi:HNH endonuclease [Arthrobacter phage DevitoJr]|uniref:HNH endonuclease n=1 Tax=Arthrobacter phage DevitoJr TaxID=2859477 RepID=A0AAE7SP49_9CAUD|nr:HNH endonuclease [Arthrobacter phage DevitoJr]QXO13228.1 HNH endonuclease [Arthrobacter phage DevitoJr]
MTHEVTPEPHKVVRFPIYDKNTNQELNEFLEIDVTTFFEGPRGLARRCRIIEFPDPTPEQEIEFLDRIIAGLPMIPEGVKLYDVNSLYPTEFFSDWYQIPNFDAYEINSGGQVRHRSNKVILDYESLPGKWIRLRNNGGEFQIVSVDDLLNTVFGI